MKGKGKVRPGGRSVLTLFQANLLTGILYIGIWRYKEYVSVISPAAGPWRSAHRSCAASRSRAGSRTFSRLYDLRVGHRVCACGNQPVGEAVDDSLVPRNGQCAFANFRPVQPCIRIYGSLIPNPMKTPPAALDKVLYIFPSGGV